MVLYVGFSRGWQLQVRHARRPSLRAKPKSKDTAQNQAKFKLPFSPSLFSLCSPFRILDIRIFHSFIFFFFVGVVVVVVVAKLYQSMGEQKPLLPSGKEDEADHLRRLKAYQPYVQCPPPALPRFLSVA
jgi:hypothetical protein